MAATKKLLAQTNKFCTEVSATRQAIGSAACRDPLRVSRRQASPSLEDRWVVPVRSALLIAGHSVPAVRQIRDSALTPYGGRGRSIWWVLTHPRPGILSWLTALELGSWGKTKLWS